MDSPRRQNTKQTETLRSLCLLQRPCVHINREWYTNAAVVMWHYSPQIGSLLPVDTVYLLPSTNANQMLVELYKAVSNIQPEAFFIIASTTQTLSSFFQHVHFTTRGGNFVRPTRPSPASPQLLRSYQSVCGSCIDVADERLQTGPKKHQSGPVNAISLEELYRFWDWLHY